MLVVEDKIPDENAMSSRGNFNIDEFIWPHGITPPLKHVRKRRFRKRVYRPRDITIFRLRKSFMSVHLFICVPYPHFNDSPSLLPHVDTVPRGTN